MALIKTPISYPGGKSRAVKQLYEIISQTQFDTYVEPFLGGGSLALYVTQQRPDVKIIVNDAFRPLCCFWKTLRDNPEELTEELLRARAGVSSEEECRELYAISHEILGSTDAEDMDLAIAFYIGNKMAYGGLMRGTDCFSIYNSKKKFSETAISKLIALSETIENWEIHCEDYSKLVEENLNERTAVYLDPPYEIPHSKLYGKEAKMHKEFSHDRFVALCDRWKDSRTPITISYNHEMRSRFPEWNSFVFELWYSMQTTREYQENQGAKRELLLTNFTNEGK